MDQSTTEDHWMHCELDTPSVLQVLQIDLNETHCIKCIKRERHNLHNLKMFCRSWWSLHIHWRQGLNVLQSWCQSLVSNFINLSTIKEFYYSHSQGTLIKLRWHIMFECCLMQGLIMQYTVQVNCKPCSMLCQCHHSLLKCFLYPNREFWLEFLPLFLKNNLSVLMAILTLR